MLVSSKDKKGKEQRTIEFVPISLVKDDKIIEYP
ncbi:hypothetical protein [[Ruminococcus] lactaris]